MERGVRWKSHAPCEVGAATRSDFFRSHQCSASCCPSCEGHSRPKLQRE